MFKTRRLILLLGIFGLLLSGCKDNSKNENTTDDDSSSKTETKNDAYATIQMDDGSSIEMEFIEQSGGYNSPNLFIALMWDSNSQVMLNLMNSEPITTKTYEGLQLTVTVKKKSGPNEKYRSWNFKSADGKVGHAKVTFTTINKTNAEGTFSGTLYSKSHRKATVEGKFMIKRKKK